MLVFFLGLLPLLVQSQNTATEPKRYHLFNETSGLDRHSILDLARDEAGFYWLATEKGVVRFDGANFTEINPPAPYTFERVRQLYIYGNWLYIMYVRQGCVRMDLRTYTFVTITDLTVSGILHLNDERILVTDNATNLYTLENDVLVRRKSFQSVYEHTPMFLRDSTIFIHIHKKGLLAMDARTLKIRANMGLDYLRGQYSFSKLPDELFFIGDQKVFRIHDDLRVTPVILSEKRIDQINFIAYRNPELTYLIDRNKTIYILKNGKLTSIDIPNLENVELRKLIVHDESNVVVATNVGLLLVQTGLSPVESFSDNHMVPQNELRIRRKILPIGTDDLMLFGYSNNLRLKNNRLSVMPPSAASAYDAVYMGTSVYYTTEDKGLLHYDLKRNRINYIPLENPDEPKGFYAIGYNSKDSLLVTGNQYALYIYHVFTKRKHRIVLPLTYRYIQAIAYDSLQGNYWIGTDQGVICVNRSFQAVYQKKQIFGGKRPLDVTELLIHRKTGQLWIAHRYGVDVIDPVSYQPSFQLSETLFKNPIVASVVEDDNGHVWMSTFEELLAYNPVNRSFIRLGSKNNLINQEYNFKSFAKLPDGRLIFGGVTGYDIIDPKAFSFNRSSDIGILTGYDLITKDNTTLKIIPPDDGIKFNIDTESLRLYLSAKNQLNSRNYTYEYQFNKDGWNSMKDASYLNIYKLDPGSYTLQFRAFDEYGSLITFKPVKIHASVVFYKNRYFIWGLLLLTIVLIALVVLNEVRRKYRENQLKEQISMDLHDEVGTILTRALMITQSTGITQKDDRIRNYLGEALYSLRVYINTMNKPSFSLHQLADELREMIHQTFAHTAFDVNPGIHIQSEKLINSEKYRDIKLCLYEILNNIVKHAYGSNIQIRMDDTAQHVRFIIQDDGILTNTDILENKGNGIRNIRKRLKKHGGIASFTISEKGHGLLVSMICPL
jgi:ligand-binding sensor domain-containing protein